MPRLTKTRRPLVLAAVMAAMFMIAIEMTIVSTAMPQIAAQLGDVHLYAWVFSAFLLTQTATTVVFGKLSDLYGRRPVLLVGIAIFLLGSLLCGFATSIPILIVWRLVQGVGAGAILPIGMTVVGDLYSVQERGQIQGYLASVWGVSSVLGPLTGGLIIQHASWAWIFWINIPIGIAAAVGFVLFLHEGIERQRRSIDILGAALFTTAIASLMIALTELGTAGSSVLWPALVFVAASALFVWQERRAADPMLDVRLWARRPILTSNLATLLSGMTFMGLTTFLPMFVQGVMGQSPLVAGFALTTMVFGWPIGATLAAKNFVRFGLKPTLMFGAVLLPIGAIAFVVLGATSSPILAGIGSTVMGFGMGFLSTSCIIIIQDAVSWAQRGSATASNIFARNLGQTLGATVLGTVLNFGLAHPAEAPAVSSDQLRRLLEAPESLAAAADGVRSVLGQSLHMTFLGIFGLSVATLLLSLLVPRVALTETAPDLVVE